MLLKQRTTSFLRDPVSKGSGKDREDGAGGPNRSIFARVSPELIKLLERYIQIDFNLMFYLNCYVSKYCVGFWRVGSNVSASGQRRSRAKGDDGGGGRSFASDSFQRHQAVDPGYRGHRQRHRRCTKSIDARQPKRSHRQMASRRLNRLKRRCQFYQQGCRYVYSF